MTTYSIELVIDGQAHFIEAEADLPILESAERAGLELPWSCRAGACNSCAGRILSGEVEGNELSSELIAQGYALLCSVYPRSSMRIETHQEEQMLAADSGGGSADLRRDLQQQVDAAFRRALVELETSGLDDAAIADLRQRIATARQAGIAHLLDAEEAAALDDL
jgi:ferredoxin